MAISRGRCDAVHAGALRQSPVVHLGDLVALRSYVDVFADQKSQFRRQVDAGPNDHVTVAETARDHVA